MHILSSSYTTKIKTNQVLSAEENLGNFQVSDFDRWIQPRTTIQSRDSFPTQCGSCYENIAQQDGLKRMALEVCKEGLCRVISRASNLVKFHFLKSPITVLAITSLAACTFMQIELHRDAEFLLLISNSLFLRSLSKDK